MKVCGDTSRLGVSAADVFAQFNASLESCAWTLARGGLRLKRDEGVLSEKNGCFNVRYNRITFRWATVDGQNFYSWDKLYLWWCNTRDSFCLGVVLLFFLPILAWWNTGKKGVFRWSLLGESKAYQFLFWRATVCGFGWCRGARTRGGQNFVHRQQVLYPIDWN